MSVCAASTFSSDSVSLLWPPPTSQITAFSKAAFPTRLTDGQIRVVRLKQGNWDDATVVLSKSRRLMPVHVIELFHGIGVCWHLNLTLSSSSKPRNFRFHGTWKLLSAICGCETKTEFCGAMQCKLLEPPHQSLGHFGVPPSSKVLVDANDEVAA